MGQLAVQSPEEAEDPLEYFLAQGHTPMMAQYLTTKAKYPDCLLFYRMGDFYEMFFEDAQNAAETLDITLTKRGKTDGTDIPMCGVPYHACEAYIARLIRAGYKVAICEQTESPEEAKDRAKREGRPASKALVNREVVRVITQGTLTEDSLLDARANNYIACLCEIAGEYGLAWAELSTGAFMVQALREDNIQAALECIDAREILTAEALPLPSEYAPITTRQPRTMFDSENARKRLEALFGVDTLEGFGGFSRAEITAAGALVEYIERTQLGFMPYLEKPRQILSSGILEIDAATRRNLELTRTITGERKGSLLATIDRTITGAGARALQAALSQPLTDLNAIMARQNLVTCFLNEPKLRQSIRDDLRSMSDMERALARLSAGRGGPRDLLALRNGLAQTEIMRARLQTHPVAAQTMAALIEILKDEPALSAWAEKLKTALVDEPPALARDGGFIARGYFPRLDELKSLRDESRSLIAALQGKYQSLSKVDTLKIKHNNVLGYFIEVPPKRADALMVKDNTAENPFIHRQTLANAVRFTTPELAELEREIASAAEKALAIELHLFEDLVNEGNTLAHHIGLRARAIAALDLTAALAELAADMHYTKPHLDESLAFDIQGGRHPVVEMALKKSGDSFVPNNCILGANDPKTDKRLWLLTGPNMAGKSTYLRQNALIAILAQIGSYVPAVSARIGIVDRVFSRVGASDDLARGRSTFMVEMVETASILNQATQRSLVILDEIGRGTATFDGLSIAWACVEHIHNVNRCRALFATHYHELTALTEKLSALSCHSMQVKEWKGDIIFMHCVGEGAADRSYGIHVAKIAGLPHAVITRAQGILETLQSEGTSSKAGKIPPELPLFSASPRAANDAPRPDPLKARLKALDPDALSPREALELLYALKADALKDTHT